jgi:hypothetical protein
MDAMGLWKVNWLNGFVKPLAVTCWVKVVISVLLWAIIH